MGNVCHEWIDQPQEARVCDPATKNLQTCEQGADLSEMTIADAPEKASSSEGKQDGHRFYSPNGHLARIRDYPFLYSVTFRMVKFQANAQMAAMAFDTMKWNPTASVKNHISNSVRPRPTSETAT